LEIKKLRLAIIGCGAIFENNHLPVLIKSYCWQVAFLIDNDYERIKKIAEKLGAGYSININDIPENIDACLIATPNYLHASQSIILLERGYHVICEKPMALNLSEAVSVRICAEKFKRLYFIVHQKRFQQNINYLRKQIVENGNVKSIDISLGNKFGWISRTNFYASPEKSGGGVFIDLGVHLFDILFSLWESVIVNEIIFSAPQKTEPIIDTGVTCFGMIDQNIPFTLRASRVTTLNNSIKVSFLNQDIDVSLSDANKISIIRNDKSSFKNIDFEIGTIADPFNVYWQNVANVIFGNQPLTSPSMIKDGIQVMTCIEKARQIAQIIIQ